VLQLPIVTNLRVVISDTAFVSRVVTAVSHIHEQRRFETDDFVTMSDTGRNEDLPRPEFTDIHGVPLTEGFGVGAEVDKDHLEEAGNGRPAIGLVKMVVKGFDGTWIAESRRDLGGFGGEMGGEILSQTLDLKEVATIVGPEIDTLDLNSIDQFSRGWVQDYGPDAARWSVREC
jgi:hypothetical protein